jgi:EAL domain-containing protein (putative c-di-GMP-specific phosphodiesterase class I)/uncharacterized coiled-coil DUF342 family protein
MSALETAHSGLHPADPAAPRPTSSEVTGWLLEGRWFTVDPAGQISAWSPVATEQFGWQRGEALGQPFAELMLAPDAQAAGARAVESALSGGAADHAGFTGDVDAVDARGVALRAAFALVPIQLSVGYEFNALLQEVASRAGSAASLAELKARHESVLTLIDSAISGRAAQAAQTEDGGRLAGALVVFRVAGAEKQAGAQQAPPPANVVAIGDADARAQLDRARSELEEAERALQRARNEADVARQEAADAHDALACSQREVEAGQRQIEEARRTAEDARAAAEDARIRSDEAQREADRLRIELRDARAAMRSSVEEFDDELVEARREADWARSEAAEHKAEAGRHAAEIEQLREHLQETQRELGVLRGELEATRAEHAQGAAFSERRGSEAERLRQELDAARAEIERLAGEAADTVTAEFDATGGESAEADSGSLSGDQMRRALEDELFQLHGQPLLDLQSNEIAQYELLIRMVGEGGKLILPQAFLEPARRAGLAHAIDRWVVRQAIGLLARVPDPVSLEVNLSPEAIHDDGLPTLIDEELTSTSVDPARLVLEVSGQTAADDIEATRALAKRVRGLGCRFALDDFRSNFGSFRLLKDIPLDYLKLDGELVGSLTESRTSQLIVKALVEVAAGTGAKTVAVFVSDDATLELLREQGVDYAQGYRVGRPRPLAEIWPAVVPAPSLPSPPPPSA